MNLQDIFKKMNSGEVSAHSELGTRDEAKQNRNYGTRFRKMKTVTGINARALAMKDVVIPFNPFTGKADEHYSKKTPFRPILLVSQVLTGINEACAQNPQMQKFWENELGIVMPSGAATMEEYQAFKRAGFIKPRIMSYSTVAINFGGIMGFPDFRVKYTVDPKELNEQGTYDFQSAPIWHKAAVFFNAMLKKEADEVVHNLEANGANKETIQAQRRAVYSKSPVGFVQPTNLIPYLFFPLNEIPKDLDAEHPMELEAHIRFYSFVDKWVVPLKEAMSNPLYDEDMDFFDFTIKTPSSTDTKKNGQVYTDEDANELYAAMTITNTDGRLSLHGGKTSDGTKTVNNEDAFAPVFACAKEYFLYSQEQSSMEGGESFEKIMAASSRFRPITQALQNFLPACNDTFTSTFANTKYCTDDVRRANAEFFTAMNPKNAIAVAAEDDEDLEAAAAAQQNSIGDIIGEATGKTTAPDDMFGVTPDADLDLAE